jgi:hypothetical protein
MKSKVLLIISLSFILVSCATTNQSLSELQVNFAPTNLPTVTPSVTPIPTTTLPSNGTIVFTDNFDGENLNSKWNVLAGEPVLNDFGLSTGKEGVSLQIENGAYPSDFTIQFDLNQCGNYGYLQLTTGNGLQFEFLSDLSTNQRVRQNNEWHELPTGRIHRCAAHIVILFKSSAYIVLNVRNDQTIKIMEGKLDGDFYGPLTVTLTPYASINHFLFTIP